MGYDLYDYFHDAAGAGYVCERHDECNQYHDLDRFLQFITENTQYEHRALQLARVILEEIAKATESGLVETVKAMLSDRYNLESEDAYVVYHNHNMTEIAGKLPDGWEITIRKKDD